MFKANARRSGEMRTYFFNILTLASLLHQDLKREVSSFFSYKVMHIYVIFYHLDLIYSMKKNKYKFKSNSTFGPIFK